MEPSFKSSYKEEVKAVKIAWGQRLYYLTVGLLWLSIVCWLVIDQVYKRAKDDPKEDWLWNGVTTCCYCSCAASFFTALFVVFFAYHLAKIFTVITCGFLCRALIF
ncbi:hypothetical protein Hanom_Chr04g00300521 [Helianthus anomalus]